MQNLKYIIKSVPSDSAKDLEDLLNEMSESGWDLYSMHEVEKDDEYFYNCIFVKDKNDEKKNQEDDVVNIKTFKSQMEKMLSSNQSPYESCKELQDKIKEQRKKIAKIKAQLEAQSEAPVSKNRKDLNEQISKGLKDLEILKQNLIKTISPEAMYAEVYQEKLTINLSEEALELVNPDLGGALISETVKSRQKFAKELGYVIPKIIFEDDEQLSPYEFSIKVRGIEVVNSFVYPGHQMFFVEDLNLDKKIKDAIYSTDEISGQKIVWVDENKTKGFWQKGFRPEEFVSRLLEAMVIKYIDELLDYADINHYMDVVGDKNMFLIENIIPEFISVAELRYFLVSLLREEISIKDIVFIFEKINDFAEETSKEDLFDKIRLSLSRYISNKLSNAEGVIQGLELSEKTYEKLFGELASDDAILRIDGKKIEKISSLILKMVKKYDINLNNLVIFTPLSARHIIFMVFSQFISNIKVVAKEEISNEYTIEILDEI